MKIKKNKNNMNLMPYMLLAVVIISTYFLLNSMGTNVNELTYTELMTQISQGKVEEISVTPRSASDVYIISGKLEGYKDN